MAKRGILAVFAVMVWTTGLFAHHPFAAEFDTNKPFTVTGTLTKIEWMNPHVYAFVDAKDTQGRVANWKVELGSPAELTKAGWTRTSIKTGDSVTFDGWRAKDGSNFANAESATLGDGKKLVTASSFHLGPSDQLAEADSRPLSEETDLSAAPQSTGTSGTQETGTSAAQELPSTGSPLALYLLLGGLSLAGAAGVRAIRR
jgi:LPXTG-motif cell wall-anchored protein